MNCVRCSMLGRQHSVGLWKLLLGCWELWNWNETVILLLIKPKQWLIKILVIRKISWLQQIKSFKLKLNLWLDANSSLVHKSLDWQHIHQLPPHADFPGAKSYNVNFYMSALVERQHIISCEKLQLTTFNTWEQPSLHFWPTMSKPCHN